ncbi:MAG: EAL domain-containing protein [Dactylosporangium sp.]|nr:EAL domain-containing protein [Dactylosporangium sp.]NNJ63388.1 EAL domain-containing protein [Dactylosporangium sp.]
MLIRRPSALVGVALVVTCIGMMIGTGAVPGRWLDSGHSPDPLWLAIGCLAIGLAELGRLRVRIETTCVELTWSEAAFVVVCSFLPAGWIPAAVLVGAGGAHTLIGLFDQRRTVARIFRSTAILTVAAAVATVMTRGLAATYDSPLTVGVALALAVGALGYALVTLGLTVHQIVETPGPGTRTLFTRLVASKLPMLLGNIAIGLLVVTVEDTGHRWLVLLLPPVAWLLHQAYGYRLRGDDERWTWRLFADVTAELNQLDERNTAVAGVQGALRLFPAIAAEVLVHGQDQGQHRRYAGERNGAVVEVPPGQAAEIGWRRNLPVEPRPLVVGGIQIGEIRLRLGRPVRFSRRDRHMLAAYGDALAAAMHDAATHRRLRTIAERSTYEALHDPVTGVVNRAALLARGGVMLRQAPGQAWAALLLLDIDRFKDVNNALGHAAGDGLLHAIALRLTAMVNSQELLARPGGDEFAVLLTGEEDGMLAAAIERARQLAAQVAMPTEVCGVVLSVEASVGVVVAAAGEVDMTELLRRADIAMYQAKRGATTVAWYEPFRDETSTDRLALLAEVRTALAVHDQFVLVLQPAVALDTGRPVGAEVLIRWDHPRRGRLWPAEFLDAVEHSELIGAFTRYVLDRALTIAAEWGAAGIDSPIAVNISARSLLDRALADDLPKLLEVHGVAPDRLTLEITESVVLTELAVVREVLASLRAIGVRIAVDDFGSGSSSLTFLTRVPVDEVKIDKVFVAQMVESAEAAAIVRTTVDLARQLGLRVVAEGVETGAQRDALHSLGCAAAQGFHFYQPLSPERATLVLRGARSGTGPPDRPDQSPPHDRSESEASQGPHQLG